jgi:hypothetical protein
MHCDLHQFVLYVGFLGAGLIVKATEKDPITGESHHLVQGITTAAATWLSAAVGLACGGGLYFIASFSTAMNLVLLRFGPRLSDNFDRAFGSGSDLSDLEAMATAGYDAGKPYNKDYGGANEISPLTPSREVTDYQKKMLSTRSTRSRPSLM